MKWNLTMIDGGRISDGPMMNRGPIYRYDVRGLPPGEQADIAQFDHRWKILRMKNSVRGEWTGDYVTAEDAFAALQKEYE